MAQMATLPTKTLRMRAYPENVFLARSLADEAAREWNMDEDTREDLRLVTDELVTNAVLASRTGHIIATIIRIEPFRLRVNVWDEVEVTDFCRPKLIPVQLTDEGGRGLHIVRALCSEIGVTESPTGGKWVWGVLDL